MWTLVAALAVADPAAEAMDAVVLVVQGSTTCAGALVDARGRVATAYHCVASGGRVRVETRSGDRWFGRVAAVDRPADLAVVDVPDLAGHAFVPLRAEPPALGEVVSALGHPFGVVAPVGFAEGTLRWSMTRGVVSAVGPRAVQFSAPVNPGNSGGPVVDEQGRLVAVVSRRTGGSEGIGFGARADRLAPLVVGEPDRPSPFGGTVSGHLPLVTVLSAPDGNLSAGAGIELALRDRVVLAGTARLAIGSRLAALQFGRATTATHEARLGVRQRIGTGRLALRVDGWAGALVLATTTGDLVRGQLQVAHTLDWAPVVGGSLSSGSAGFDLGWAPTHQAIVGSVVLRWPGVLAVF